MHQCLSPETLRTKRVPTFAAIVSCISDTWDILSSSEWRKCDRTDECNTMNTKNSQEFKVSPKEACKRAYRPFLLPCHLGSRIQAHE